MRYCAGVLRLGAYLRARSPRQILLAGWLGFMAYAFPGYMSFDSIVQLRESRRGYYIDGHPPAMAALWRIVELFVAGPIGMLVIQTTCFLVGGYLVFSRLMSARRAAVTASLLLWFPPIAAVMAVIWKDSQMAAFLVLGFGLIIQDRRRTRIWGLVALLAATLMRHNALVITGPLIVICFTWDPAHRFVKRHAIAIAAWVAVTFTAQVISGILTDEEQHIWHTSLALCDMTATLRYTTTPLSDAELAPTFTGVEVLQRDAHAFARDADLSHEYVNTLWKTTYKLFGLPHTKADRDAVTRAWKQLVFSHVDAYLAYRWEIFSRLLGVRDNDGGSPVYNWFSDVQDPFYSASRADHDAAPAHFQDVLRRGIHIVGTTPIFEVFVYVALCVLLIPFAFADRRVLALIASAITSEGVLFVLAPTSDWRYSFWLILAVTVSVVMLVAIRMQRRSAAVSEAGGRA
jgi:hypothetical protein